MVILFTKFTVISCSSIAFVVFLCLWLINIRLFQKVFFPLFPFSGYVLFMGSHLSDLAGILPFVQSLNYLSWQITFFFLFMREEKFHHFYHLVIINEEKVYVMGYVIFDNVQQGRMKMVLIFHKILVLQQVGRGVAFQVQKECKKKKLVCDAATSMCRKDLKSCKKFEKLYDGLLNFVSDFNLITNGKSCPCKFKKNFFI